MVGRCRARGRGTGAGVEAKGGRRGTVRNAARDSRQSSDDRTVGLTILSVRSCCLEMGLRWVNEVLGCFSRAPCALVALDASEPPGGSNDPDKPQPLKTRSSDPVARTFKRDNSVLA